MSTRCQIQVIGSPILIYKHCDGYPEGVLPTLEPFAKTFAQGRGKDPEYCLAQIIRMFAIEEEKDGYVPPKHLTGWGLDQIIHGDIEFLYIVDSSTGKVTVVNTDFQETYERHKS